MALMAEAAAPTAFTIPTEKLRDSNSNNSYNFNDLKGLRGTLVIFMDSNSPFVTFSIDEIVRVVNDYRVQRIGVFAVSCESNSGPLHSITSMTEFAFRNRVDFPYLYDPYQRLARAFNASVTPDFYLFDADNKLFYHGRLDDARPGSNMAQGGSDLRSALDALLLNRTLPETGKPSVGNPILFK